MENKQGLIMNNRERVRDYGEVFTPVKIVNDILDMPGLNEASRSMGKRFLEPTAGEGVFLVQVLLRKLTTVASKQSLSLVGFENYSLYALSSLYGIELLEDNVQRCGKNLYETYYDFYKEMALKHGKDVKENVLQSAKFIISKNIVEGDFLKRLTSDGRPIVFTEWKITNLQKGTKELLVQITEYTLDQIFNKAALEAQRPSPEGTIEVQETIDSLIPSVKPRKNKPVPITEVYRGDEIDGSNGN